jgi:hypothetical protein
VVGELLNVFNPVQQTPPRLVGGQTHAWSIDADEADIGLCRSGREELGL